MLLEPTSAARALAEHAATMFGGTARAILHYGSRAQGRVTRPDSAFDFFVIVHRYGDAYRSLDTRAGARRRVWLPVGLAWILPPNALALRGSGVEGEVELKCIVISMRHFKRECSRRARDHFVRGRLCQSVVLAWARNQGSAAEISRSIQQIRDESIEWAGGFLPRRFTVAEYCRTLIAVSLQYEIRPERKGHAEQLFQAQAPTLLQIYSEVLSRLAQRGVVERREQQFELAHPPSRLSRLRVHAYFRWSRLRTSLRLLKHPFLYDHWLDYLLHKIDRSTGVKIELTARERRWPLVFLWPRAWRYLRTRPQQRE